MNKYKNEEIESVKVTVEKYLETQMDENSFSVGNADLFRNLIDMLSEFQNTQKTFNKLIVSVNRGISTLGFIQNYCLYKTESDLHVIGDQIEYFVKLFAGSLNKVMNDSLESEEKDDSLQSSM